jgi:hypothetical protein
MCESLVTKELPKEEAARGRRTAALATKDKRKAPRQGWNSKEKNIDGPCQRYLNLSTYKLHALGDYVNTVQQFGPTDNYTTQVVCHQNFPIPQCLTQLAG